MFSALGKVIESTVRTVRQKTIDAIWKGVAVNSMTGERSQIIWHAMCFRFDKRITGSGVAPGTKPAVGYELQGNFNPADGSLQIVKTFHNSNFPTVVYTGRLVESNHIQGEWVVQGKNPSRGTFDIATESFRWEGRTVDDKTYDNQPVALDIAIYQEGVFGVNFSPQTGVIICDGDYNTGTGKIDLKQVFVHNGLTRNFQGSVKNAPYKHMVGTYSDKGGSGSVTLNKIEVPLNQLTLSAFDTAKGPNQPGTGYPSGPSQHPHYPNQAAGYPQPGPSVHPYPQPAPTNVPYPHPQQVPGMPYGVSYGAPAPVGGTPLGYPAYPQANPHLQGMPAFPQNPAGYPTQHSTNPFETPEQTYNMNTPNQPHPTNPFGS